MTTHYMIHIDDKRCRCECGGTTFTADEPTYNGEQATVYVCDTCAGRIPHQGAMTLTPATMKG